MSVDIDRIRQRTWRYWYEDGLSEIAGGALFVALGLVLLAEVRLPPGPARAVLATLGMPVVAVGGSLLGARAVRAAKERLTYPRTGVVRSPRPTGRRRLLTGVVAGLISALLVTWLGAVPSSRAWLPGLQGLLIGAGYLYVGQRFDLARFHALAVFSAVAGAVASLTGLGDLLGSAACFWAVGAAMAAGGVWALHRYLQQPPLAEVGDDGP